MPIHKSRCQDRIEPLHRQRVRLKGTNVESNRAVEDCLEFMSRPIFLLTAGVYAARGSTDAAQRGAGLSRQRRNVTVLLYRYSTPRIRGPRICSGPERRMKVLVGSLTVALRAASQAVTAIQSCGAHRANDSGWHVLFNLNLK